MAVTSANTIIVYRSGDTDSESVADYYVARHGLSSSQKISVPCSSVEILNSEGDFNSEVLNPIKTALASLSNIYAVVLGYKVPRGYIYTDGSGTSHIVSSTSRISRLNHDFNYKSNSELYDRKKFKRFDGNDAQKAIVAAQIDGPSARFCKDIIDKNRVISEQYFINGTFYVDPYSDKHGSAAAEYQDAILNFATNTLPKLNLNQFITTFLDPYVDVYIPSVTNDSFVWSWFTDRSSSSFFKSSNAIRTFFYNADYDGAALLRDLNERRWPILALQSGYANTAGSMSNPGNDAFIFPRPFFEALLRGSTIGEAYLFSLPYYDSPMTFIGDPLTEFSFPAKEEINDNLLTELESIKRMFVDLAKAMAYREKKIGKIEQVRDNILDSGNIAVEVDMLQSFHQLYLNNDSERADSEYTDIIENLYRYIEDISYFSRQPIDDPQLVDTYLTDNDIQISELIASAVQTTTISDANILDQGLWSFDQNINDDAGAFAFYHFDITVARDQDLSDVIFSTSSQNDLSGWFYEGDDNEFIQVTSVGVESRFAGNRVRYISPYSRYLSRGDVIYIRLTQRDQLTLYSNKSRTFKEIVYT